MGFIVYQMDVKSVFLYGTIDEEVYVMQPSRFQDPEFPDRVYKVEKAMYGLHQAPSAWYGKQKVVESEAPKKRKIQEQIDAQVAREMEEEFAREDKSLSEQLARDSKIERIHAEEDLKMMIEGLDRSNEVIAKHLQEYEQAEADLTVGEKIELINKLVKYQDHHAKIPLVVPKSWIYYLK
nr:putative ribonuclease H-like domain-containing protein [Tanacetum cinerariifolium]